MREGLRTGLEATIRRRLARDAVTATVSYTRDDGIRWPRVLPTLTRNCRPVCGHAMP